ncbi:MAG: hypothetical protein JNM18_14805 [Planctomycetaceae bacterium]|nr:hypothetical protein [Planctomycetaceae bacterium]
MRLLDLAGTVRGMSLKSRENSVPDFELHGQKIDEWLAHLEDWAHDGAARLETALIRQRGARRAQNATPVVAEAKPEKRSATKKGK